MRLDKAERIAGFPIGKVRDLLRGFPWYQVHPGSWPERLGATPYQARRLLRALESRGFLEPSAKDADFWCLSEHGIALTHARLTKPFRRETAARALAGLLARAKSLEGTGHPYVYRVLEVRVFGSYLREDADRVGDLDVGLDLTARYADREVQHLEARKRWRDPKWGPPRSIIDEMYRDEREVLQYLKARSPVISLQPILRQGAFWDRIPWRTVYELPEALRKGDPEPQATMSDAG